MACGQGQGEIAVQRQGVIEGFRGACLRTKDAINSKLILLCSFRAVSSERSAYTCINHVPRALHAHAKPGPRWGSALLRNLAWSWL